MKGRKERKIERKRCPAWKAHLVVNGFVEQ